LSDSDAFVGVGGSVFAVTVPGIAVGVDFITAGVGTAVAVDAIGTDAGLGMGVAVGDGS